MKCIVVGPLRNDTSVSIELLNRLKDRTDVVILTGDPFPESKPELSKETLILTAPERCEVPVPIKKKRWSRNNKKYFGKGE